MPIRVVDEYLDRSIRAVFWAIVVDPLFLEVLFGRLDIFDMHGKMCAARLADHFAFTSSNKVQFLIRSEAEPGAGKLECRPWKLFEA